MPRIIKRRIRFHESASKALTICIVFVFCRDSSDFSTPIAPTVGDDLTQTESFEYTERSGTTGELSEQMQCRLDNDSSLHLQLARAEGTTKKQSTQNTQFAHVLFFVFVNERLTAAFCICFWRCQIIVVFVFVRHKECMACASFRKCFINSKLVSGNQSTGLHL